jgi:hypothetical protein
MASFGTQGNPPTDVSPTDIRDDFALYLEENNFEDALTLALNQSEVRCNPEILQFDNCLIDFYQNNQDQDQAAIFIVQHLLDNVNRSNLAKAKEILIFLTDSCGMVFDAIIRSDITAHFYELQNRNSFSAEVLTAQCNLFGHFIKIHNPHVTSFGEYAVARTISTTHGGTGAPIPSVWHRTTVGVTHPDGTVSIGECLTPG